MRRLFKFTKFNWIEQRLQNLILTAQLDFCSGVERTERFIRLQFLFAAYILDFTAPKIYGATGYLI